MANVTELNREPDISANAIDAGSVSADSLNTADIANAGNNLALLSDGNGGVQVVQVPNSALSNDSVSVAGNSVALGGSTTPGVTDFGTGTVNDGEFVTNSGGSLTGGTVQTEPNVPNWTEVDNSPVDVTNIENTTLQLNNTYNFILILLKSLSANTGDPPCGIRVNGKTDSSYRFVTVGGTKNTGASAWNLIDSSTFGFEQKDQVHGAVRLSGTWGQADRPMIAANVATTFSGQEDVLNTGWYNGAVSPLDQISFVSTISGETIDVEAEVYGR